MRYLLVALVSLVFVALGNASCKAVVYDLTTGGVPVEYSFGPPGLYRGFTVEGPFPNGYIAETFNVTVLSVPDLPPKAATPSTPEGWSLEVFGNSAFQYFACGSDQYPGDCASKTLPNGPYHIFISPPTNGPNLIVDVDASEYFVTSTKPLLYDISIDLPPGYSIEGLQPGLFPPNVPEPSTWAMLLIGFAAVGFAGYRRRSKPAIVAVGAIHVAKRFVRSADDAVEPTIIASAIEPSI
jgi:hypothetical protein